MSELLLSQLPLKARKETDEHHDAVRAMIEQFTLMVAAINFPETAIAGAIGADVPVVIELQDANDVRMLFGDNKVGRVQVDVDGTSTAAGAQVSLDGENYSGSVIAEFTRGQVTVFATGTGAGTVVLALVDVDGSGLTLGGDATVTLS